jgi:L-2-hydroxyglutarate oxidase LhgO
MAAMAALFVMATFFMSPMEVTKDTSMVDIVNKAGKPVGTGGFKVTTKDMLEGGSGSPRVMNGQTIAVEKIRCDYVINCAGGASDQIAALIGDESFKIKPRLGDYILLNRNQVRTCLG